MAEPKERTALDAILAEQRDDGALAVEIARIVRTINSLRNVAEVAEKTEGADRETLAKMGYFAKGLSSIASAGGDRADISVSLSALKPVADEEYVKRLLVDTVQKAPGLTLDNPKLWENVAKSLLTDHLFTEIDVQDVRLKNAILDTNQWAVTYPDHILAEDIAASLGWAQRVNEDISQKQWEEIRQFASEDASLAPEGSYAKTFFEEFAGKEQTIRDNALASRKDVGVTGGRPGDLDIFMVNSIAAEEAANIPAGSPRSNRVTPGVDKAALRREAEAQAFIDKGIEDGVEALMWGAFFSPDEADYDDPAEFKAVDRERKKLISDLKGFQAQLERNGATPEQIAGALHDRAQEAFTGGVNSKFATGATGEEGRLARLDAADLTKQNAAFKAFMARNGQLTSAITPEDALWMKNQVAATGDLNNFANFDGILPTLLEKKRAQDAAESVSTEDKATSELGRALFERGYDIGDITPGASFGLASGAQDAGGPDIFASLTDENIRLLEANKRAIEDTEGALGAFGVAGAPGSAFQEQVEADVAPFFKGRLEEIEADQPFLSLEARLEGLLGGPRPSFEEAISVRGRAHLRDGRSELWGQHPGEALTPGEIFASFQESQQPGVGPFGAYQLDPELYKRQFDPTQVPGLPSELKAALTAAGHEDLIVPDFSTHPSINMLGPQFEDIDSEQIRQLLLEQSGGDLELFQYLLDQVGSEDFAQRFLESSVEAFGTRREAIETEGRGLREAQMATGDVGVPNEYDPVTGKIIKYGRRAFDAGTEADFGIQRLASASEDKFRFEDFIQSEKRALKRGFQQTPGFLRSEESRIATEAADIEEAEKERRRTLRSRPRRAFT
jgi:hypothetical protein